MHIETIHSNPFKIESDKIKAAIYPSILKERLALYSVDTLLDEEILTFLTGISIEQSKSNIKHYGLN
jgi:hypothetical protein